MLNIHFLKGALWRVQHVKSEQQFHPSNVEGSWNATQNMAELLQQEAQIINLLSQYENGTPVKDDVSENIVKEIYNKLPEVK